MTHNTANPAEEQAIANKRSAQKEDNEHSLLHKTAFYLPNRIFDLMDIFRLRLGVGPGLSAGARATELAQAYIGAQTSVYVGLPGPRQSASIPFPVGLESHNGVAIGPIDATANLWAGPNYSATEIGASVFPFIFGLDFGLDPWEIVDFGVGIFGFDLRDDDF